MPGGPGVPQMPRNFRREQGGTGFIVDKNGYIITNNHVVDGADRIKVKMHGDQTEYKAKLIGVDAETDLAVIKIDPKQPLTPVTIANSDSVQVGDWAVAIGSPFGLEASVTAGIISATGRDIGSQQFQRFIQTDAAINPGNSGGPLLNIRGEVIGVNTMIATQNGGSQGVGFALPINMAVRVYNDIIKYGEVRRGSIGISWQRDEKPEVLKALGTNGGVLVSDVKKGGPAEKAGLKPEDIVVALNGTPIRNGDDLVNRVADLPIGSQATVTVDRAGKRMDFKVTVLDRKEVFADDPRVTGNRPKREEAGEVAGGTQAKFGISIRTLNDEEREFTPDKRGVMVTRVEEGSFAEDIGLMERDIIVSVNRQPVNSVDDVKNVQANLKPGDAVAFRVVRRGPAMPQRGGVRAPQPVTLYLSGTLPNE
jgi:serine protease Do